MSDDRQYDNLIFISYTKLDRDRVSPYYSELKRRGYNLWMDVHEIKGGQNWDFEIMRAMNQAVIIIAFVSANTVDRRGYLQKELRLSLEKYKEKLVDDIFLIPFMLDDIEIPMPLRALQVVSERHGDAIENIIVSISTQFARLGDAVSKVQEDHGLKWNLFRYKDAWNGLPGYDASYQYIQIHSSEHSCLEEIGYLIRGDLSRDLMAQRQIMFTQDSGNLNFGQGKYWRTNTYDAKCVGVVIVENVISIEYAIYTYLAGAAHGYAGCKTYVFLVNPTILLSKIEEIFNDKESAFHVIQEITRSELMSLDFSSNEAEPVRLHTHWVKEGTSKWEDFSAFSFTPDGLALTFSPYQVAAYSFGPQRVTIRWRAIRPFVHKHLLCALGREFEHFNEKTDAEKNEFRGTTGVMSDIVPVHDGTADVPAKC